MTKEELKPIDISKYKITDTGQVLKMTKDEMKDRISMALKDPVLQQGFEITCKENAKLKGEAVKWHRVSDGDIPKENKIYLVEIKDNGLAIAYFNGLHWETRYNLGDSGHCVETVIAWCEIPKFKE